VKRARRRDQGAGFRLEEEWLSFYNYVFRMRTEGTGIGRLGTVAGMRGAKDLLQVNFFHITNQREFDGKKAHVQ
jgi:hypothetical protein